MENEKPDWKDAPEWAQFVAQDEDGGWWWYECEPDQSSGVWSHNRTGGRVQGAVIRVSGWKETLEARP